MKTVLWMYKLIIMKEITQLEEISKKCLQAVFLLKNICH